MTLPGGYALPLKLSCDILSFGSFRKAALDTDADGQLLHDYSMSYLADQMIAGTILTSKENLSSEECYYLLRGEYSCCEMIGREHWEKMGDLYGKNS